MREDASLSGKRRCYPVVVSPAFTPQINCTGVHLEANQGPPCKRLLSSRLVQMDLTHKENTPGSILTEPTRLDVKATRTYGISFDIKIGICLFKTYEIVNCRAHFSEDC